MDIIQVFKIARNIDKIPFENCFENGIKMTRGNGFKLFKPRPNTRIRENSFSHRVINLWNKLPKSATQCIDMNAKDDHALNTFKTEIEKAWHDNPIKYNFD